MDLTGQFINKREVPVLNNHKLNRQDIFAVMIFGAIIFSNILNLVSIFRAASWFDFVKTYKQIFFTLLTLSYPLYILSMAVLVFSLGKQKVYRLLLLFASSIAGITLLAAFVFNFLEARNYANYVYSRYGIFLPSLRSYADFQLILLSLSFLIFNQRKQRVIEKLLNLKNLQLIVVIVIVYGILSSFPPFFEVQGLIWKNYVILPADEKKEALDLGNFTELTKFITEESSEDVIIINPSQSVDYPTIGNQALLHYFVFPRTLVSASLSEKYLSETWDKKTPVYSILIKSEVEDKFFPQTEIMAEKIVVLRNDGSKDMYFNIEYGSGFLKKVGEFRIGLIKHKL